MIKWIKGKAAHILILGLLAVYVLSANSLYVGLILRNGKPSAMLAQIPAENNTFSFDFGSLEQVRYDGQNLYAIHGYALHNTRWPSRDRYNIKVILHSTSENLVFNADSTATPDVISRRPDYQLGMLPANFQVRFSKNVLKVDNYQIGILLEDQNGAPLGFRLTGSYIERTPNTVRFLPGGPG